MPATRQDLFARLDQLGIVTRTIEHEAVFTVAESSRLERELPGGHTKNLFLKDKKDRLFLVVALGHAHIDLKTLNKTLGSDRLSFGRPELLMEVLGVPAGSVTPFVADALPSPVSFVIVYPTYKSARFATAYRTPKFAAWILLM